MKNSGPRYYQQFDGGADQDDTHHENVMVHVVPESKSKWNHIEDLDAFFTRIYVYHQQHGFLCMMVQESLQLLQFAFVVWFATFLLKCVDYKVLFRDEVKSSNGTKVLLADVLISPGECVSTFGPSLWACLFVAFCCWVLKLVSVIYHFFQYGEISKFYKTALHIDDKDLDNLTWHDIQKQIRKAQLELQMCIHKPELTELDIYLRILRHKNYLVAMANKNVLPFKFNAPFIGESVFLSRGLKFNIEFLLFWGPWAPFDSSWHLREDFKRASLRHEHARQLSKHIFYLGIVNLLLSPLILLWQLLYAFFGYAEIVKREPGSLGVRRWSLYGRLFLRHFNELDHELQARLSRAYQPASSYLSGFSSNLIAILAKNLAFLAGAILAVLVLLTVYDEDVITVDHVLTIMTVLGAVVAGCRVLIPEENLVWCPETLMDAVLSQVHYLPTEWKGKAHTSQVRNEFSKLFQFKAIYLLEELISPLITPFILILLLRPKALEIVDFLRHFTVEVVGAGDVCSFAQLDIHKHGQPQWRTSISSEGKSIESVKQEEEAEDGKTELSLIRFNLINPEWRPPPASEEFLSALKSQIQQEFTNMNPLLESTILRSFSLNGVVHGLLRPNLSTSTLSGHPLQSKGYLLHGCGISKSEGPRSLPESKSLITSGIDGSFSEAWEGVTSSEPVAANMAVSTLYLHDALHRSRSHQSSTRAPGTGQTLMPNIEESPEEDDHTSATHALSAAVQNLAAASSRDRMAKSN